MQPPRAEQRHPDKIWEPLTWWIVFAYHNLNNKLDIITISSFQVFQIRQILQTPYSSFIFLQVIQAIKYKERPSTATSILET